MRQIIYRVENRAGLGPYKGDTTVDPYSIRQYDLGIHPGPYDDGISGINSNFIFGFASMRRLKTWFFPKVSEILKSDGYKISVYKVPITAIKRGKKQVAFDALSGAVRVRVRELQ